MNHPVPDPVTANPYTSPAVSPPGAWPPFDGGVWQRYKHLVVHRRANLPALCLTSGEPATHRVKLRVFVHPWFCLLGLLFGPIGYLVMIVIFVKHAQIYVGLSEEWNARRKRLQTIGLITFFASLTLTVASILLGIAGYHSLLFGLIPGVFLMMIGLCIITFGSPPVFATRITPEYIWLRGVNRMVREKFPPWQWGDE